MATIDPLEHAAALLRAVFVMSCREIELALIWSEGNLLLQIGYTLRSQQVRQHAIYVVARSSGSTRGAERLAVRAALVEFRQGINWAASVSGPLAALGPVMLPARDIGPTSMQPNQP